jgi:hypothetical protein
MRAGDSSAGVRGEWRARTRSIHAAITLLVTRIQATFIQVTWGSTAGTMGGAGIVGGKAGLRK